MNEILKKVVKVLLVIIVIAGTILNLAWIIKHEGRTQEPETYKDTVQVFIPVPKDSVVLRYETVKLPLKPQDNPNKDRVDTTLIGNIAPPNKDTIPEITIPEDSIEVELPITQKVYRDSSYCVWISGYEPQLDSLEFYYERPVIPKDPLLEWSIGVQAGVGWFGDGFHPYIGVGVQIGIDLRKISRKHKH